MKKLMSFAVKYRFFALTFLFVAVCGAVTAQVDSTQAVVSVKPDFSTPQSTINTVGGYIGALITILIGFIPAVKEWAGTSKGYKALKIAMVAAPVLVVVFIFGFKGDVVQIVLNTLWGLVGGLGGYALFVRPLKELGQSESA